MYLISILVLLILGSQNKSSLYLAPTKSQNFFLVKLNGFSVTLSKIALIGIGCFFEACFYPFFLDSGWPEVPF